MAKKGTEYEKLVERVANSLLRLHGTAFKNIKVQRDIKLPAITKKANGKPILRQIDVYWEFVLAGITYKAVVQAKDWNRRVSLHAVDTLKNVLLDLPGQPRGIIVTPKGCQRGAFEFAQQHGIEIFHLRPTEPGDFGEQAVPSISAMVTAYVDRIKTVRLATKPGIDLAGMGEKEFADLRISDATGEIVGSMDELLIEAQRTAREESGLKPRDEWLTIDVSHLDLHVTVHETVAKIHGVEFWYQSVVPYQDYKVEKTVTHILHLATNNELYFVDNNSEVRLISEPLSAYSPVIDMNTVFDGM
jgi:hypothetical protein